MVFGSNLSKSRHKHQLFEAVLFPTWTSETVARTDKEVMALDMKAHVKSVSILPQVKSNI